MSFFPRSTLYHADPSFTPLFRLLDEFDTYNREARGNQERHQRGGRHNMSSFTPRFDVRETDDAYELHGELPGIDRDKIDIEFTDPQTLVIRGRTERNYTSGTPPAGLVEGNGQPGGAITEKGEEEHAAPASASAQGSNAGKGSESSGQEKNNNKKSSSSIPVKYWVQERTVGEFARTFNFPGRVDQDAATANLNNGVLSLMVPKAKKRETRRIAVN